MSYTSSSESLDLSEGKRTSHATSRARLCPLTCSEGFRETPENAIYVKTLCRGCFAIFIVIFGVFSIYWGALWKLPAHTLRGWVVDLDGGTIGAAATSAFLVAADSGGSISWEVPQNLDTEDVGVLVKDERTWVAVVINANASSALSNANTDYQPADAITVYVSEARSENAFRTMVRPVTERILESVSESFAEKHIQQLHAPRMAALASTAPNVITHPISYRLVNLAPFDIPVASALTFVGLIFLLILSFFFVMIGVSARDMSGVETRLSTASLIELRLLSVFSAYFVISLFYSLLSLAFQVDFTRTFGHSGFLIFWMLNYVGMLSVGLLLEALVPLLTPRFLPFFLITWVIVNVSVCGMPIDVLPHFFRYGYAIPFYNISVSVRTILFGTKNQLPLHFGILLAWVVVSVALLVFIQYRQRKAAIRNHTVDF